MLTARASTAAFGLESALSSVPDLHHHAHLQLAPPALCLCAPWPDLCYQLYSSVHTWGETVQPSENTLATRACDASSELVVGLSPSCLP